MRKSDINLLRTLIREFVNEGQVPSSDIVFYQSPSSSFKRIQMPGAAALKTIGVLYAVDWLGEYVKQDCMANFDSFGMPIPQATKAFAAYSAVSIPADSTNIQGLKSQQAALANDWAVAINKDINGDTSKAQTGSTFDKIGGTGGLNALFRYIESNLNSGKQVSIWQKTGKGDLNQLTGHNDAILTAGTEFANLVEFIRTLLNAQCDNAVDDAAAVNLIRDKFQKRSEFISFVKTYTDTMWKDYEARKNEQLGKIEGDNYKIDQKTMTAIKSVATAYQSAINQVI